jgi:hypothetical protein
MAGYFHEQQDGFSMPYMYAVIASNFAYGLIALFIIAVILRRRFSDGVIAAVILILGLGTNLYYLEVFRPPFCHSYLLFWYALLIYFTIGFYGSMQRRYLLLIGLCCGMIILTRPNEMYAVVIPVLWGIGSVKDIKDRFRLMAQYLGTILCAALIAAICIVPQLLYWKVSTGAFLFYSYTDEHFDFLHPHIWGGLFDGANGWLVYSPIMILALAGLWKTWKSRDASFTATAVYLCIHVYVIYSWWCWFYMGSYGSRPMTEAYALLSIPMAYSVEWLMKSWPKRIFLAVTSAFCIWLVIMQTYQSALGIFNSEFSNWRFNWVTLGKTHLTYEEAIVLDTREFQPRNPVLIKTLYQSDLDDTILSGTDTTVHASGRQSVCVKKDSKFFFYIADMKTMGAKKGQWIKASVNCLAKEATNHNWHLSPLVIMCSPKNKSIKWRTLGLQNKINNPKHEIWHFPVNEWGRAYFYSQIPDGMTDDDEIRVYVEHKSGPDIYIDDVKVELYEEK